jgi:hypothetical protein
MVKTQNKPRWTTLNKFSTRSMLCFDKPVKLLNFKNLSEKISIFLICFGPITSIYLNTRCTRLELLSLLFHFYVMCIQNQPQAFMEQDSTMYHNLTLKTGWTTWYW